MEICAGKFRRISDRFQVMVTLRLAALFAHLYKNNPKLLMICNKRYVIIYLYGR